MYYSQRHSTEPYTDKCSYLFWNSLVSYIQKLLRTDYLYESFGDFNELDHRYFTSTYKLNQELLFKLGKEIDPVATVYNERKKPPTNDQLDLIEFIFEYISKPTSSRIDTYYNVSYPDTFDKAKGRYEYTIEINALFERNRLSYKIEKGHIRRTHSKTLDSSLISEGITSDELLKAEVQQAINLFLSRDINNTKTALTVIANAFERAKTLAYPSDKRESAKQICRTIASDKDKLAELFSSHFMHLTDISNYCDIRHKESGKIIIDDYDLQEYLFYSYFSAIRLMDVKMPSID